MNAIDIDLPLPPSVNLTRRVNWAGVKKTQAWREACRKLVMYHGMPQPCNGPCEITIVINEKKCRADPDNYVKSILDYLVAIELIPDDRKKFVRRFVVEFGKAPEGCRVTIRSFILTNP